MPKEKKKNSDFILEIGCEELPPFYTKDAILQLEHIVDRVLKEARLGAGEIISFGTYRRIGFLIKNLAVKQKPEIEQIIGPPQSAAFDEQGKPTKTFYGFLNKTKTAEKNIQIRDTEKGQYLCAVKEKPVLSAVEILPSLCQEVINSIQFPKTMRWQDSFSFARPVRWVTAFLGNKQIKFKIADVICANYTFGHRLSADKKIKILNADDYFKQLKKHKVLIYPDERKKIITRQLKEAVGKIGAEPEFDENLLEEIVYLTEWPVVFTGRFEKKYLRLPAEVLLASMSKNQKTFALLKKNGAPMPNFAVVIDNGVSKINSIKKNYESILEAKLKDAEFFYAQDTRRPFEEKNKELEKVIFHKDIGTVFEKVKRLERISLYLAEQLNFNEKDKKAVLRSARLSKADLTTQMVKEFPSLQGIMGAYYAEASGESQAVAGGIKEHYLPKSSSDNLPRAKNAAIVSFADKLDTVISCLAVNLVPTGSYDPYALRRQGQGLVRIALGAKFDIDINKLISLSVSLLEEKVKKDKDVLAAGIILFLKERLRPFLIKQAKGEDLVDAVLNSNFDNFVNIIEKIKQLSAIRNSKDLFNACKIVERTANILKSSKQVLPPPNPRNFTEKLEKDLFEIYQSKKEEILKLISQRKYTLATKIYGQAFFDILHIFFDKILINVDNQTIRQNRLALMRAVNELYTRGVADISLVKLT